MKIYLQIEDGRDDRKKIQNGSYFHQGPPRGMNAKEYSKNINLQKIKAKNNSNNNNNNNNNNK